MKEIKWTHIMDSQPENGSTIIQLDPPYDGHYCMGMRKYYTHMSWDELLKVNDLYGWSNPDFWWMYAKDFPFPDVKDEV